MGPLVSEYQVLANAEAAFLQGTRPDPCTLVIFGATGDLTQRKLIPALYNLYLDGTFPKCFSIVGVSRSEMSDEAFRQLLTDSIEKFATRHKFDAKKWAGFVSSVTYVWGSFEEPKVYEKLASRFAEIEKVKGCGKNRLIYMATPPHAPPIILHRLNDAGLIYKDLDEGQPWSRIIVEKPYGHNLDSAMELTNTLLQVVDERQVYRIDHYLGKETVQNILAARFGNTIFEPLWNRKYIDHIQITAAETIGVERRGRFYDKTGVVRDMVQSHLLQVLALSAMEQPLSFCADDIRDKRVEVLRSLRPWQGKEVFDNMVFGQYRGYRDEENVDKRSRTPTYVAMRCYIDNWRWQGVPFYLRVGKQMRSRTTEISIVFRPVPHCLFGRDAVCQTLEANVLNIRIQPDEGIDLKIVSKLPGDSLKLGSVEMDFSYAEAFDQPVKDAYERLIVDAMRGDATLFARRDEVEHAWRFVSPLLDAWEANDSRLPQFYAEGSDGPEDADDLMAQEGKKWRPLV